MVTHNNQTRRDTLGRTFRVQDPTLTLHDTALSGERESIRGRFLRVDDRKGGQLLLDRSLGGDRRVAQAPLDSMRMRHGDGLKVAERILPLRGMDPSHKAECVALFRNPAVVRAYVTNPDETIRRICETKPHLRDVLEVNAPFTKDGDGFRINTQSRMYATVERELSKGIQTSNSALLHSLDRLLSSPLGASLGGSAGMETASYKLLRSVAEQGPLSARATYAAYKLDTVMRSDRAHTDLAIVSNASSGQRSHAKGGSAAVAPSHMPVVAPQIVTSMTSSRDGVVPLTPAPAIIAPVAVAAPALRGVSQTPAQQLSPTSQIVSGPFMSSPVVSGLAANPAPIPVSKLKESPSVGAAPQPQPSASLSQVEKAPQPLVSPTMQRLVDVVNSSSLETQIGSPRNKPILELSDKADRQLKQMLTDPVIKGELLSYSDEQLRAGFQEVRPDRIKYLEEWLAINHRNAVRFPGFAQSQAGITPADTNRIGQVVSIARQVAQERETGK